jgi:hypothetical protein
MIMMICTGYNGNKNKIQSPRQFHILYMYNAKCSFFSLVYNSTLNDKMVLIFFWQILMKKRKKTGDKNHGSTKLIEFLSGTEKKETKTESTSNEANEPKFHVIVKSSLYQTGSLCRVNGL